VGWDGYQWKRWKASSSSSGSRNSTNIPGEVGLGREYRTQTRYIPARGIATGIGFDSSRSRGVACAGDVLCFPSRAGTPGFGLHQNGRCLARSKTRQGESDQHGRQERPTREMTERTSRLTSDETLPRPASSCRSDDGWPGTYPP
jgi:hypothetical protein